MSDDPTRYLVEPAEPQPSISQGFANPFDLFNYVSPSAWINEGITALTGFDVFNWMSETIGGDWATLYKFGDALANLAKFHTTLGTNVQDQAIALDPYWDGNAADGAYRYQSDLAAAISGQQLPLNDIADRYHQAARGAWELASQLSNVYQAIADLAIIAGVSAVAGDALAETGVGTIIGYGLAALMVVEIMEKINKASVLIQTFGTVILGLFGFGADAGSVGDGGELERYPLPAGAYAKPGA
jgi:hypothetical protein